MLWEGVGGQLRVGKGWVGLGLRWGELLGMDAAFRGGGLRL